MNTEQYTNLIRMLTEEFDTLKKMIEQRKPGRKAVKGDPRTDLTRARVEKIEELFWTIVNAPIERKRGAYKVPRFLCGSRGEINKEAVIASVLLNQASLRKVFRMTGAGDSHTETPIDRARRALEASNLVVLPLDKTDYDTSSSTRVALSPGEARRVAQKPHELPEPKGWTTTERAVAVANPFDDGRPDWLPVPKDPCGARVWPGENVEEVDDVEEVENDAKPVERKINIIINPEIQ